MSVEIIKQKKKCAIRAAVFDFDGTISTLRRGWENVMEPLMLELITNREIPSEQLLTEVRTYIDQSTGIQTIFQMRWLAETVARHGLNPHASDDPWWYKAQYNDRLMKIVEERLSELASGADKPEDYLMDGSAAFLQALQEQGIPIYGASGTDHPDVLREAKCLGVHAFFTEIAGAPLGVADCSKEAVLRKLMKDNGLSGPEILIVGDGKVEIALGNEIESVTVGVASDEALRHGVNEQKRQRLIQAGAHIIVDCFADRDEILSYLGLTL